MTKLAISIMLIALALAACGDSGTDAADLVGVYQVTLHTRNEAACDVEGGAVTDYDYFQLLEDEFLGQPYLSFGECTSSDPASCTDGGLFSSYFKVRGDWVNELHSSSGGGSISCYLGYVRGDLFPQGDGSLRFETRVYSEEDTTLSEEECNTDEAEARGDSMPCESYEAIEGVPVDSM